MSRLVVRVRVQGSTPKLKRQAQLVCGLKNAMLANDVRLMGDIVRVSNQISTL